MTPFDEGKSLYREILKLRPDKRRRYPADLRRRILSWVDRATDAGAQEQACAKTLGMKTWRFTVWRRWDARVAAQEAQQAREAQEARDAQEELDEQNARDDGVESEPLALVPIEIQALQSMSGPMVVTPSGYRIEGLSLAQVVALLRELA